MILDIAGGEATKEVIDIYPKPLKRKVFKVCLENIIERLSYEISVSEFEKLMKNLNCQFKKLKDKNMRLALLFIGKI